jgi:hypothetical protein
VTAEGGEAVRINPVGRIRRAYGKMVPMQGKARGSRAVDPRNACVYPCEIAVSQGGTYGGYRRYMDLLGSNIVI